MLLSLQNSPDPLLDALASLVEKTKLTRIANTNLTLAEALQNDQLSSDFRVTGELHQLAQELEDLIVQDPRFRGTEHLMLNRFSGMSGFYPTCAGAALVNHSLSSGSPKLAISWLEKLLTAESADGIIIATLWGAPVDQVITFNDTVSLVPIKDLPGSPEKLELLDPNRRGLLSSSLWGIQMPQSALVYKYQVTPHLTTESSPLKYAMFEVERPIHEALDDIGLVLTLIGPRCVLRSVTWFNYVDSDIEKSLLGRGNHCPAQEIMPLGPPDSAPLDPYESKRIVNLYLALSGQTRDKLRVAINRLNRALIRRSIGDRAVELSIAFEALLSDGGTAEMTHKVKVRATRLLGGADEQRSFHASILTKTYEIRSKLVHTGHDETGTKPILGNRMPVEEIVKIATNLCSNLIIRILERGSIPEWSTFDISDASE